MWELYRLNWTQRYIEGGSTGLPALLCCAVQELSEKIWEEIQAMPEEFETLKEEWKRTNSSSDPGRTSISTLSSSLDTMKERLSNMQVAH